VPYDSSRLRRASCCLSSKRHFRPRSDISGALRLSQSQQSPSLDDKVDDVGPTFETDVAPGILPSTLRARLRRFPFAPAIWSRTPSRPACSEGGAVKVNTSIEDPVVLKRILAHLARRPLVRA
jgi:hypothetical protein